MDLPEGIHVKINHDTNAAEVANVTDRIICVRTAALERAAGLEETRPDCEVTNIAPGSTFTIFKGQAGKLPINCYVFTHPSPCPDVGRSNRRL